MSIHAIDELYRNSVNKILADGWGCPPSVSKGKTLDTTILPGFVFVEDAIVKGVVTYHIENGECEIVTLNSLFDNQGIGTMLIQAVRNVAESEQCSRLWLITSNDNARAIRFYQKRGFDLAAVHLNAMDVSRKLKPSIPLTGTDGIPLKHEFEFEIRL